MNLTTRAYHITAPTFRNVCLGYQGFSPQMAHIFEPFSRLSFSVGQYYGADSEKAGTMVHTEESYTGERRSIPNDFEDNFYQRFGKLVAPSFSESRGGVCMIPFSVTQSLRVFAGEYGIRLAQNSSSTEEHFGNKAFLLGIAHELRLPLLPGTAIYAVGEVDYLQMSERYGGPIVIQKLDQHGGSGTYFINNLSDYRAMLAVLEAEYGESRYRSVRVKVSRYADGPSPNITACVIGDGVVLSPISLQITGGETCPRYRGKCIGSVYNERLFPQEIRSELYHAARVVGGDLAARGYRGIFGMDFLTNLAPDGSIDRVYISEINARLVGELQYMDDMLIVAGGLPLTFFHAAAWLGAFNGTHAPTVRQHNNEIPDIEGSCLRVYQSEPVDGIVVNSLKPGVYSLAGESLEYIRRGTTMRDCGVSGEFVVTNCVPRAGTHFVTEGYPSYLCSILTHASIVDEKWQLLDYWKRVYQAARDGIVLAQ